MSEGILPPPPPGDDDEAPCDACGGTGRLAHRVVKDAMVYTAIVIAIAFVAGFVVRGVLSLWFTAP